MDDDVVYVWPEGEEFNRSEHTEHQFCSDMACPCHEDQERINELSGYYNDGLASKADADRIYRGKVV